jgi:hypothetical protein
MTLSEQAESIRSREDFVVFVRALRRDLHDSPASWENADLGRYLEALGAWVEDMDGYYSKEGEAVPDQPQWKYVASMLLAAKVYE